MRSIRTVKTGSLRGGLLSSRSSSIRSGRSFSITRAAAAEASIKRPDVTKASVNKEDDEMWKAYSLQLHKTMCGGPLGEKSNVAFFAAPPNTTGIPGGSGITQAQINAGVYNIANSLIDPSTKKYIGNSSFGTYTERLQTMLDFVELPHNTNAGAQLRLAEATAQAKQTQAALDKVEKDARTKYDADQSSGKMPFEMWAARKYPSYHSLMQQNMSTQASVYSLINQAFGAGSGTLTRHRNDLAQAISGSANPGLTMQVDDGMIDQLAAMQAAATADATAAPAEGGDSGAALNVNLTYKPSFSIDSAYSSTVKGWVNNTNQSGAKPFKISYKLSSASNSKYSDVGLREDISSGSIGYWFVSVSYSAKNSMKDEHISMQEVRDDLEVTLTGTGYRGFSLRRGIWDTPDFEKLYYGKWRKDQPLPDLPEAYFPTQLFLGYNVGTKMSMSSTVASKVKDMVQRAAQYGGSVSFLGRPFGLGGLSVGNTTEHKTKSKTSLETLASQSSFTDIDVPGEDNTIPTLLGVLAQRMKGINGAGTGIAGTG